MSTPQRKGSFAAGVAVFTKEASAKMERLRRAFCLSLFQATIMSTPVDTGRLRGNWRTSKLKPEFVATEVADPEGWTTAARASLKIKESQFGDTMFLTNSLPYAYRIEYEGWSHTKAPQGMVRHNARRITENMKRQRGPFAMRAVLQKIK